MLYKDEKVHEYTSNYTSKDTSNYTSKDTSNPTHHARLNIFVKPFPYMLVTFVTYYFCQVPIFTLIPFI